MTTGGGCVISTFDELRELGHVGANCLSLIQKLVREEVRRFPSLAPTGQWQAADLEDIVGDFLADRLERVTATLMAQAVDDASMGRLLRRSIRHWLIDQARKTGVGATRRTLERALQQDDQFEEVPAGEQGAGRWRLVGVPVPPWSGAIDDLVEAARAGPNVRIPKWASSARRPPVADRASIVATLRAMFAVAEGSLEVAQLVEVFVRRFPVVLDPVVVPASEVSDGTHWGAGLTPQEQIIAAEDDFVAGVAAAEIVGMLSPDERRIVPHLDNTPAVQALLGCGRSQAYQHTKRLKEKLAQLVGDGNDVRPVGLEVIRLCGGATPTTD